VFTGSGNSTGTPRPSCLLLPQDSGGRCAVSLQAMQGSPDSNRNYRGNPGVVIQYAAQGQRAFNIQIDMGKTYRESMLRWYPRFGVPWVDAVVLTHDHADACFGLDELRTVQRQQEQGRSGAAAACPVFAGDRHMPRVQQVFPYLVGKSGGVPRYVARVDWRPVADFETFTCPGGLEMTAVPVWHGADYVCQAYVFGARDRVAYVSDVTEIPDATMAVLKEAPLSLLVLDALLDAPHPTHMSLDQALDTIRALRPKRALLLGMSDQLEHHATNARLRDIMATEGLDIQLAHDGMHVDLDL